MNYNKTYTTYQPFAALLDEFPEMYDDTVHIIVEAIQKEIDIYVVSNNRAGGNAPKISQKVLGLLQQTLGEN
jgi:hypothetical protein